MVAGDALPKITEVTKNAGRVVDMRSDTVTQPTEPMRQAMATAEVGDDVFGDDPTVIELERYVSELLGKEAGLFVTSGTMGNLISIGLHCNNRGDEVICGSESHAFYYEQGGASSLMGVAYHTIPNQPDGTLSLDDIRKAIRPENDHFTAAKLVVVENTQNKMGGYALPIEYMDKLGALCKELGLKLHIDGARLWNAAVKLGVSPRDLTQEADSVTVCLSKGLGAPVGSVLVGEESFITRARRMRKALGGGMRQAGILAAAGLYALKNNIERLRDDHANAQNFAKGLKDLGLHVLPVQSNMIFFDVDQAPKHVAAMRAHGLTILCVDGKRRCRAVVNLHVSAADIVRALEVIKDVIADHNQEQVVKRARMA